MLAACESRWRLICGKQLILRDSPLTWRASSDGISGDVSSFFKAARAFEVLDLRRADPLAGANAESQLAVRANWGSFHFDFDKLATNYVGFFGSSAR